LSVRTSISVKIGTADPLPHQFTIRSQATSGFRHLSSAPHCYSKLQALFHLP
jgi:hypothetical protein